MTRPHHPAITAARQYLINASAEVPALISGPTAPNRHSTTRRHHGHAQPSTSAVDSGLEVGFRCGSRRG